MLPLSREGVRLLQQHGWLRSLPTQRPACVPGIRLNCPSVAAPKAAGAAGARHFATAFYPATLNLRMAAVGMRQQQKHFAVLSRTIAAKRTPPGGSIRSWQLMGGSHFPTAAGAMLLPRCCFASGAAGRHSATASASLAAVDEKRRSSLAVVQQPPQDAAGMQRGPLSSNCRLPLADTEGSAVDRLLGAMGVGLLHPQKALKFAVTFLLNFRFYFMYMARTTFQAVRPLLAFCVFGEVMKLVLATMSSGLFSFLFSFVLAFEVLYFFLQCYISYTFLTMFFTVLF